MRKIIIILTSVIIVLGAVLCGVYFYNTTPSTDYDNKNFSFKVPKGFRCTSTGNPDEPNPIMYFECLGEDITIFNIEMTLTPEAFSHKMFSSEERSAKVEKLEGYPYDCYFYSSEETYKDENGKDKHGIEMSCIIGTDTHFMVIDCFCSPLKAKIIKPAIKKFANTVKYISDFRLADKPDVFEYDYLSINTGSKYLCRPSDKLTGKDYIFSLVERYAEADDPDKFPYPVLNVLVFDNGSSPADLADEEYNKHLEEKHIDALTRDQKDMFGFNCEHFRYESKPSTLSNSKPLCRDYYYFSKDKYTYAISVIYHKDSDEADIKEMLDGITIK
ncbi:hypothetical protein [Ruminococcus flavefaciens]|uniref:Uncharacterized protein n=1 Tax=Ruminococcus flavefaciens TaxID=1265 RepID=A0A1M7KVT5_RUMFL|nr:hypothetical protein [Ruminococcus flavefaciens]SHM69726.1 hypothetical protein SAMN04487860_11081 [Ruminococcus flavefaciens]